MNVIHLIMKSLGLFFVVSSSFIALANDENKPASVQNKVWVQAEKAYILQQSQTLVEAISSYQESVDKYCAAPELSLEVQAKKSWQASYEQWLVFDGLGLGPLQDLRNVWSLSYFPDKKDQVARQISTALAETNPQATLNSVQSNLRAHEALLFDEKFRSKQCDILPQAALRLLSSGLELHRLWSDWASKIESDPDAQRSLLASYRAQLGWINKKIQMVVNEKHRALRPMLAEAWRSQLSNYFLQVQMGQFIERSEQLFLSIALDDEDNDYAIKLRSQQQLRAMADSMTKLAIAEDQFKAWQELLTLGQQAYVGVEQDWAKSQNLAIGFNNNDGD